MFAQVSWIRHRDTSLLAVNKFVYTTSHRVKVGQLKHISTYFNTF